MKGTHSFQAYNQALVLSTTVKEPGGGSAPPVGHKPGPTAACAIHALCPWGKRLCHAQAPTPQLQDAQTQWLRPTQRLPVGRTWEGIDRG